MICRLKKLRENHDLTQKQLSERLQISQQTYSLYEIGKQDIPFDVFIRLAKFYGVSLDYIAGLTNDPMPYPPAKKKRGN